MVSRRVRLPRGSLQKALAVFVLMFVVSGVLYGQILNNYFLNDDFGRILSLNALQDQGFFRALVSLFADPYCSYYRPFTFLQFFLLGKVIGFNSTFYYLSSMLLHVLSSTVVYLVARSLASDDHPRGVWFALFTALLFTVHPRQVESVSFIHDNENVICGLFYLLGFLCFMRYCRNTDTVFLAFSCLCYLFSLFGKEMGVTLPLVCLAYYTIFFRNLRSLRLVYRDPLVKKSILSFGTTFLIYLIARYHVLGTLIGGAGETSTLDFSVTRIVRTLIQAGIAMVVPNNVPGLDMLAEFFRGHILLFISIGLVVTCVVLYQLRHLSSPKFLLGAVWALIALLPVLNNGIGVHELTGGRYLYIPLAGFSLCTADLLIRIRNKYRTVFMAGLVLALMSAFAYRNNVMMSFASHLSSGFLMGLGSAMEGTQGKNVVVLVPRMYKGIYVLNGLSGGVTFLYGDRGRGFLEHTTELSLEIEDKDAVEFRVSREDDGFSKITFLRGARFIWKNEYYSGQPNKDMGLAFSEIQMANTRGELYANVARFTTADLIIAPDFQGSHPARVLTYTVQRASVVPLGAGAP